MFGFVDSMETFVKKVEPSHTGLDFGGRGRCIPGGLLKTDGRRAQGSFVSSLPWSDKGLALIVAAPWLGNTAYMKPFSEATFFPRKNCKLQQSDKRNEQVGWSDEL